MYDVRQAADAPSTEACRAPMAAAQRTLLLRSVPFRSYTCVVFVGASTAGKHPPTKNNRAVLPRAPESSSQNETNFNNIYATSSAPRRRPPRLSSTYSSSSLKSTCNCNFAHLKLVVAMSSTREHSTRVVVNQRLRSRWPNCNRSLLRVRTRYLHAVQAANRGRNLKRPSSPRLPSSITFKNCI